MARRASPSDADTELAFAAARSYTGLRPSANPFSHFQVFPADPLYRFPLLGLLDEEETRLLVTGFVDSSRVSLKDSLERLQGDSPFRRGHAEAFPDEQSSPEQPAPENSLQISSASLEALPCYDDPLRMSRDYFRDSLTRSQVSDLSDQPSRAEISLNTREILHNIQRAFAVQQDERNLHSITPESSFFKESRESESLEFDPRPPEFEVEESLPTFQGTDESITEWESMRPSLYRKSRLSETSEDMSLIDEGSAFCPPVFQTGAAMSLAGKGRMPEIKEEDLSCAPHSDEMHAGQLHPSIPKPVFIPEKVLLGSVTPSSFGTLADNFVLGSRDAYSPIVGKAAVFCVKSEREYELQSAFGVSGCVAAPTLEFSNLPQKSRGRVANSISELPPAFGLLSEKNLNRLLKIGISWVTCGFEHTAAVSVSGKVYTWGYGAAGVLGHGDTNSLFHPRGVAALAEKTVVFLESGAYHTAAATDKGELWTWGRGDMWQLGLPKTAMFKDDMGQVSLRPQRLAYFAGVKVQGVACGEAHTLVLDSLGRLYSFGWGAYGQLGIGLVDPKQADAISQVKTFSNVRVAAVSCGLIFSACVTETGQVWVWGSGESGQLGLGGTVKQTFTPTRIDSLCRESVIDILCGETHAIALTRLGDLYAWGTGLAGVFSGARQGAFREGSEIVCYVPQRLSQLDAVYRFSISAAPHEHLDLFTRLQQLQTLEVSSSL